MAILSNLASLRLVEHKGTPACRALAAEVANEYTQFCVDMLGAATGVNSTAAANDAPDQTPFALRFSRTLVSAAQWSKTDVAAAAYSAVNGCCKGAMRLLRDFQAKRFAARATVDGLERVRSQLRKSRTTLAEQGEDIAQLHASEFLPTAMWLSERLGRPAPAAIGLKDVPWRDLVAF